MNIALAAQIFPAKKLADINGKLTILNLIGSSWIVTLKVRDLRTFFYISDFNVSCNNGSAKSKFVQSERRPYYLQLLLKLTVEVMINKQRLIME